MTIPKFTTPKKFESSFMEVKIENLLSGKGTGFYREVSFVGCVNPLTVASLRYDFYIPSLNMIVEYDGKAFHATEDVQARDRIKDVFAERNGIKMVRISGGQVHLFGKLHLPKENGGKGVILNKKHKKDKVKPKSNKSKKPKQSVKQALEVIHEFIFKPKRVKTGGIKFKNTKIVKSGYPLGLQVPKGMTENEYRAKQKERKELIASRLK